MHLRKSFLSIVILSLAAVPVFGHGPQIQITNEGNKIVTRQLFQDGPYNTYDGVNYTPSSAMTVYVIPLAAQAAFNGTGYWSQPNSAYAISGSGLAWTYGWTFDTSAHTTFPVGNRFVESLTGDLKIWNGTTFDFNPLDPARPQLELFKGSTAIIGGPGTVDTGTALPLLVAPMSPSDSNLEAHSGIRYQLLGDGRYIPSALHDTQPVADGIYLQQLGLSLPGSGVANSDPFYFVLYKGVIPFDALAAAQAQFPSASIQLVPEPGSLGLLIICGMTLIHRRRRVQA